MVRFPNWTVPGRHEQEKCAKEDKAQTKANLSPCAVKPYSTQIRFGAVMRADHQLETAAGRILILLHVTHGVGKV
jgi:hypothetical protein